MKPAVRAEGPRERRFRKWWIFAGLAVVVVCAAAIAVNAWAAKYVRARVVSELGKRFDADVRFASLDVTVFPQVTASGSNFVLERNDRPGFVIRIGRFSMATGLLRVLFPPRHVSEVHLDGLEIQIPPRQKPPGPKPPKERKTESPVVVDRILSDRAAVITLPKKEGKLPLRFDIHRLVMEQVGLDRPAPFRATLHNAKPPGEIAVEGSFGPWRTDDAGQTPLAARYTFTNADLGTFHGISGILASTGKFGGVLERLDVDGETDTPDFMVRRSGHKVHLKTEFHAIVDGTNGDTLLEPVRAHFLNSGVVANGGVVKQQNPAGRRVELDANVSSGRVEDMIRLATKGQAVLTGDLTFTTKFDLPPGEADIMDKLRLDGQFGVGPARFTKLDMRQKLQSLSRRGKGEPENEFAGSDVSNLKGRFRLRNGVVTLQNLVFQVEGASVHLDGTYSLRTEELNFRGKLMLAAKISEATTGVKSVFLKLIDPLFKKKNAGAVLPIRITGTREKPSFGLDVGRVFKGDRERPGRGRSVNLASR